jgi:hypothetical protein
MIEPGSNLVRLNSERRGADVTCVAVEHLRPVRWGGCHSDVLAGSNIYKLHFE